MGKTSFLSRIARKIGAVLTGVAIVVTSVGIYPTHSYAAQNTYYVGTGSVSNTGTDGEAGRMWIAKSIDKIIIPLLSQPRQQNTRNIDTASWRITAPYIENTAHKLNVSWESASGDAATLKNGTADPFKAHMKASKVYVDGTCGGLAHYTCGTCGGTAYVYDYKIYGYWVMDYVDGALVYKPVVTGSSGRIYCPNCNGNSDAYYKTQMASDSSYQVWGDITGIREVTEYNSTSAGSYYRGVYQWNGGLGDSMQVFASNSSDDSFRSNPITWTADPGINYSSMPGRKSDWTEEDSFSGTTTGGLATYTKFSFGNSYISTNVYGNRTKTIEQGSPIPYEEYFPGNGFVTADKQGIYALKINSPANNGVSSSAPVGYHYVKKNYEYINVGYWVANSYHSCIHSGIKNISGIDESCHKTYLQGAYAFCADCGRPIGDDSVLNGKPYIFYGTADTLGSIKRIRNGSSYIYYCPNQKPATGLPPYTTDAHTETAFAISHQCVGTAPNRATITFNSNFPGGGDVFKEDYFYNVFENNKDLWYASNPSGTKDYESLKEVGRWRSSQYTSSFPSTTRKGYSFEGWYTNASCTGTVYNSWAQYQSALGNYADGTGVTLYAKWKRINPSRVEYYDENGGTKLYTTGEIEYGDTYSLSYTPNPSVKSKTFTFNGNGGTISGEGVASTTRTATAKFVGWEPMGTYSYAGGRLSNDRDGYVFKFKAKYSDYTAITTPGAFKSFSTVFEGWYTAASGGSKVTAFNTNTIPHGTVYYAHYTAINYKVNLNLSHIMNGSFDRASGSTALEWGNTTSVAIFENGTIPAAYRLYRRTPGGSWAQVPIQAGESTSASGVSTGSAYAYTIPTTGIYTVSISGGRGYSELGGSATLTGFFQKGQVLRGYPGGRSSGASGGSNPGSSSYNGASATGSGSDKGGAGAGGYVTLDGYGTILSAKGGNGQEHVRNQVEDHGEKTIFWWDGSTHTSASAWHWGAGVDGPTTAGKYGTDTYSDSTLQRSTSHEGDPGTIVWSWGNSDTSDINDYYNLMTDFRAGSSDGAKKNGMWSYNRNAQGLFLDRRSGWFSTYVDGKQMHSISFFYDIVVNNSICMSMNPADYNYGANCPFDANESYFEIVGLRNEDDENWDVISEVYFKDISANNSSNGTNICILQDDVTRELGAVSTAYYWESNCSIGIPGSPGQYYKYVQMRAVLRSRNDRNPITDDRNRNMEVIFRYINGQWNNDDYTDSKTSIAGPGNNSTATGYIGSGYVATGSTGNGPDGAGSFSVTPVMVGLSNGTSSTQDTRDSAAPNVPIDKSLGSAETDSSKVVTWGAPADNGSTYEFMVSGLAVTHAMDNPSRWVDSDVRSTTVTTGIKGYVYRVDTSSGTTITNSSGGTSDTSASVSVTVSKQDYDQWLHVAYYDQNGNVGPTLHVKVGKKAQVPSHYHGTLETPTLSEVEHGDGYYSSGGTIYLRADRSSYVDLRASVVLKSPYLHFRVNELSYQMSTNGGATRVTSSAGYFSNALLPTTAGTHSVGGGYTLVNAGGVLSDNTAVNNSKADTVSGVKRFTAESESLIYYYAYANVDCTGIAFHSSTPHLYEKVSSPVKIQGDSTAPSVSVKLGGTASSAMGNEGTANLPDTESPYTFVLQSVSDGISGVKKATLTVNGKVEYSYNASSRVTSLGNGLKTVQLTAPEGTHVDYTINVYAEDNVGNVTEKSYNITVYKNGTDETIEGPPEIHDASPEEESEVDDTPTGSYPDFKPDRISGKATPYEALWQYNWKQYRPLHLKANAAYELVSFALYQSNSSFSSKGALIATGISKPDGTELTYYVFKEGVTYYIAEAIDEKGQITRVKITVRVDASSPVITFNKASSSYIDKPNLENESIQSVNNAFATGDFSFVANTTFNVIVEDKNTSSNKTATNDSSGIKSVTLTIYDYDDPSIRKTYAPTQTSISAYTAEMSAGGCPFSPKTGRPYKGTYSFKVDTFADFPDSTRLSYRFDSVDYAGNTSYLESGDVLNNFLIKAVAWSSVDDAFNSSSVEVSEGHYEKDLTKANNIAYFKTGEIGYVEVWTIGYVEQISLDFGSVIQKDRNGDWLSSSTWQFEKSGGGSVAGKALGEEMAWAIATGFTPAKYALGSSSRGVRYQNLPYTSKGAYETARSRIVTFDDSRASGAAVGAGPVLAGREAPYAAHYTYVENIADESNTNGWLSSGVNIRIPPTYAMEENGSYDSSGNPFYKWEVHPVNVTGSKGGSGSVGALTLGATTTVVLWDNASDDIHYRITHETPGTETD